MSAEKNYAAALLNLHEVHMKNVLVVEAQTESLILCLGDRQHFVLEKGPSWHICTSSILLYLMWFREIINLGKVTHLVRG